MCSISCGALKEWPSEGPLSKGASLAQSLVENFNSMSLKEKKEMAGSVSAQEKGAVIFPHCWKPFSLKLALMQ